MTFFAFWEQVDPAEAFPLFGSQHIWAMILIMVILSFMLNGLKKLSPKAVDRIIKIAAIAVPVVECTHTIWLYLCGQTEWIKLLPLHLCAMQSIFIPLAVFSKWTCFKEFIYSTSILGGICAIVFPVGVADTYPFVHYQTIQTLILHSLLIFVPLALIIGQGFRPNAKHFPAVIGIFLVVVSLAAVVDFSFGENYIFLNTPPAGTPFVPIFAAFGRVGYLLAAFTCLYVTIKMMYLPFAGKKATENYQPTTQR